MSNNRPPKIRLFQIKEWEWVPLTAPSPYRFRMVDPADVGNVTSVEQWVSQVSRCLSDPRVAQSTDAHFPGLNAALQEWARKESLNTANRGALAECAMRGAAVAHAELATTPLRQGFTHPRWHVVLDYLENEALEEAGPAGIVALNAAHRGEGNSTDWVEALAG